MKTLFTCLLLAAAAQGAPRIAVHAHRGASAIRPENTIPSFQEAIRAGADFIEMDVLVTVDNVLVIAHDPVVNLDICQGPGGKRPIHEMTLAEVRQYDCGTLVPKTSPRRMSIPGTRIPTLDEVLDLAKTSTINFNIEIKSSREWKNLAPPPEELSRMVVDAIRKHKVERRVLVQSFDFRVVKAVRAIAPELKVAALYMGPQRSFTDIAQETGAQIVTPNFSLVTAERVKEAHDQNVQVVPWTVDAPEIWDRLLDMGVDGIITNDPAALVAHLKGRGQH